MSGSWTYLTDWRCIRRTALGHSVRHRVEANGRRRSDANARGTRSCSLPTRTRSSRALLGGFGSFPDYFRRLPEVNRRGPHVYGTVPALPRLELDRFRELLDRGAQLIDARPMGRYAAGHIPDAISIELRSVFATWLGWLVDASRPVIFVLDDDQDRHELVRQALTVGVEDLAGELEGGYDDLD